jgi:hypothetical protein
MLLEFLRAFVSGIRECASSFYVQHNWRLANKKYFGASSGPKP